MEEIRLTAINGLLSVETSVPDTEVLLSKLVSENWCWQAASKNIGGEFGHVP